MGAIDVEILCLICGKWKASGTISADESNLLPNIIKFVKQEVAKHPEHGLGGKWQINYGPR